MQPLLTVIASFVVAIACAFLLMRLAQRVGLMDHPGGRKEHAASTPLIGGLAIALAASIGLVLAPFSYAMPLAIAMVIIAAVGIADDIKEVSPLPKFLSQAAACLVMVYLAGNELRTVGELAGFRSIGMWIFAAPMTVFAVIGVINSINMIDGIDGHSGGVALVAFAAYAYVAHESGMTAQYQILVSLVGATLAFLLLNARWPWNKRARTFLGDAGSMLIGFLLGWFAIDLTAGNGTLFNGEKTFPPICALWVIVIPLCDCVSLMARRRRAGRSMFMADRQHLHHYLLNRGFSVGKASAFTAGLSIVTAGIGILGWKLNIPEVVMFVAFVCLFVGYHRFMSHAFKTMPQHSTVMPMPTAADGVKS